MSLCRVSQVICRRRRSRRTLKIKGRRSKRWLIAKTMRPGTKKTTLTPWANNKQKRTGINNGRRKKRNRNCFRRQRKSEATFKQLGQITEGLKFTLHTAKISAATCGSSKNTRSNARSIRSWLRTKPKKRGKQLINQEYRREAWLGKKAGVISADSLSSHSSKPQSSTKTSDNLNLLLECQRPRRRLETTDRHRQPRVNPKG